MNFSPSQFVHERTHRYFFQKVKGLLEKDHAWAEIRRRCQDCFEVSPATDEELAAWVEWMVARKHAPGWFRQFMVERERLFGRCLPDTDAAPEHRNAKPAEEPEAITDAGLMLFRGTKIGMRGERGAEQLCLTDMWRANGANLNTQPAKWRESAQARTLLEFLAESSNIQNSEDWISADRGPAGRTWAHWQLAFAYAKYLSPAFHVWVNQAAREKIERSAPTPTIDPTLAEILRGQTAISGQLAGKLGDVERRVETLAAASEASRVAAEAAVELAGEAAARAEHLANQVKETRAPAAPALRSGFSFFGAVAEQFGLPSRGVGKFVALEIAEGSGLRSLAGMMVVAAAIDGRPAMSISVPGIELCRSRYVAAAQEMRALGYVVRDGRMVPGGAVRPTRGKDWVRKRMLDAAASGSGPQPDLPFQVDGRSKKN